MTGNLLGDLSVEVENFTSLLLLLEVQKFEDIIIEISSCHHPSYVYHDNMFAVSQMIARPQIEGKVNYLIF